MARRQRAKRAAAAAETKIKNDVDAISLAEGKAPSSMARAPSKGSKNARQESAKERQEKPKPALSQEESFCEWTQAPSDSPSNSSGTNDEAKDAHKEHMRRRALREVHSNRPMKLSRRSSYRISRGRAGTPVYSPIMATKLKLTPDADASCLQNDSP